MLLQHTRTHSSRYNVHAVAYSLTHIVPHHNITQFIPPSLAITISPPKLTFMTITWRNYCRFLDYLKVLFFRSVFSTLGSHSRSSGSSPSYAEGDTGESVLLSSSTSSSIGCGSGLTGR